MTVSGPEAVLAALEEDRQTAWVPDPLGDVDALDLAEGALTWPVAVPKIEILRIPKPDGSSLAAPILPLSANVALHLAVNPLKESAQSVLAPGVCGYRRGAEAGRQYTDEHRRFVEMAQAEAENAEHVITADVRQFFRRASWMNVLRSVEHQLPGAPSKALHTCAGDLTAAGLSHLPAGYADARFLGNIVLSPVDYAVGLIFARWVDDYRIFADSLQSAAEVQQRLASALSRQGLELNRMKTVVIDRAASHQHLRRSLQSVYHPDVEPPEQVRSALTSLFADAALDPIAHRRNLRFALRRLALETDDIAVEWTLSMLNRLPWEAPRLTYYLSRFVDREYVRAGVEHALAEALRLDQTWLAIRLATLGARTGVTQGGTESVVSAMSRTASPSLWGSLLRFLALGGRSREVRDEVSRRVLDPRVAIAALADIGDAFPKAIERAASRTADVLKRGPAPPPLMDTLL
jgi:hypothetical protein